MNHISAFLEIIGEKNETLDREEVMLLWNVKHEKARWVLDLLSLTRTQEQIHSVEME